MGLENFMIKLKYKIVGTLNIAFGVGYLLAGIALNVYVFPRLTQIYDQFNILSSQLTQMQAGRVGGTVILFGICLLNFYLGYRLFRGNKNTQENDFLYGLAVLGGSILFSGIATGLMSMSIMLPMYSLTESF